MHVSMVCGNDLFIPSDVFAIFVLILGKPSPIRLPRFQPSPSTTRPRIVLPHCNRSTASGTQICTYGHDASPGSNDGVPLFWLPVVSKHGQAMKRLPSAFAAFQLVNRASPTTLTSSSIAMPEAENMAAFKCLTMGKPIAC